jgi:tetratricopeptide (TPR) repeat protein
VHAVRAGGRRQAGEILRWLALVASEGPTTVEESIRRLDELLEQGSGDRKVEIGVFRARAKLEAMRGQFDAARGFVERGKALADELGDHVALAAVLRDSSSVMMLAGDPQSAETEVRAGYEILERISDFGHLSSFAPDLGEAMYAQGRYEEAFHFSEVAERITIEGDADANVRWRALRAKTLARRGLFGEAEAIAAEAVHLVAATDYLDLHADALLSLSEVLRLADRPMDAASTVRQALDLYRRKGNIVSEARAESLLAELGG